MTDHLGPYELRGELGRGAMAVVWRAWDPRLEREVAIKEPVIPHGTAAQTAEELATRFVLEGKAAARLSHPGIVVIHGADVYDGRPAIVMESIRGETLGTVLERGPLSPASTVAVLDQLLDAVAYAHEHGVVHRDIKPDNVFVTDDGRIKLTDFGIAHVGGGAGTLTQAGTIMGTPGYMAPEQVIGEPVDARTDLFAIGAIGYEMLTGRNPFGAADGIAPTTIMYRIVHEAPSTIPESLFQGLPVSLSPAIATALAKDPADRFVDAHAFRAAIAGGPIVTGRNTGVTTTAAAAETPVGERLASPTEGQKRPLQAWLPYAAVAVVGAAVVLALVFSGSSMTASGGPASFTITSPQTGSSVQGGSVVHVAADVAPAESGTATFYSNGVPVGTSGSAPYACDLTVPANGPVKVTATFTPQSGPPLSATPITLAATDSGGGISHLAPASDVNQTIQNWQLSWEAMDFTGYMAFYAPDFVANYKHMNRDQWQSYKQGLFAKYSFQRVGISNLSVTTSGDTATATFNQSFQANAYHDSGSKTLTLQRIGGVWLIAGEEYR
jgi:serine/threonine-protein kinase